jgi:hypothetical protein
MSIDNISPTKKALLAMWDKVREQIISPECDDEAIIANASKLNILNQDAFREEDFMTYDEAIKALGISYNRNKLSDLAKKHGIKSRKFKNSPAGFHKDDIARLKLLISQEGLE